MTTFHIETFEKQACKFDDLCELCKNEDSIIIIKHLERCKACQLPVLGHENIENCNGDKDTHTF